ncbi:SusC/RagA family TonB-linked outer membrane protein [Sphingobacterium paucimobilis]|nr:TonB-dependent receptor [Sphingobacterium paucimobilis]
MKMKSVLQTHNISWLEPVFWKVLMALCCLVPTTTNLSAHDMYVYQQTVVVTGKVVDDKGGPLEGVSIQVKGQNKKTATDAKGNYKLQGIPVNSILVFSHIGSAPQEHKVSVSGVKNVTMVLAERALEDVVVIGYGTVKKDDLTGSVSQVDMKDLMEAPVGSFDEALAGRVAGVQVSSSDGQPGAGMNIVIRGANSLTQSNAPLYVIDGFPIEDPDNAAVNPEEIESLTILKDASATAIYGARGANGVIIIQTKKGKVGKPIISLNSSLGFQQVAKTMKMMTPWEFVNLQMEISPSRAKDIYTTADLDPSNENYDPNGRTLEDYRNLKGIDWQNLLFRKSLNQNHTLSLRGGTKTTRYSFSGSIFDQQGIIINTGSNRYQARLTLDHEFNKKFRIGLNVNYSENERTGQIVNAGGASNYTAFALYRTWAYRPVTGRINYDLIDAGFDDEYENESDLRLNPIITAKNDYTHRLNYYFTPNVNLEYDINNKLKWKSVFSLNSVRSENQTFYNSETPHGSPRNRFLARGVHGIMGYSQSNVWSNENTLTYKRTFAKAHNLEVMGGFSVQEGSSINKGFGTMGITDETLIMQGLELGIPYTSSASAGEFGMVSGFGRLNYDFKSRYLLTMTYRADGSSKFAKGNRFSYFPSFAAAWNMKREEFLKYSELISEAKLRVSYGATGNNRIGNYDTYGTVNTALSNTYSFGNKLPPGGVYVSKMGNDELRWETTEQLNIGYDLSFLNKRVSLTLDYYQKTTKDLLLNADMPISSGFERVFKNIGSLQNNGFEVTLNTTNINNGKFSWRSSFNIGFNNNKIIKLTRNQHSMFSNMVVGGNTSALYVSRVGYPAGMFYGYIFDGIYQVEDFNISSTGKYTLKSDLPEYGEGSRSSIQPGYIRFKDLNGDGRIDDKDMSIIGRGQPIHAGGFANNFSYKGFYLHVFLQWSYGNDVFNANRMIFDGNYSGLFNVNQYASYNDRWTPENRSNTLYKPSGGGPPGYLSNRTLEDGSFLRLKTVSLSYTIPAQFSKKAYINKLSLRMAIQNLLTFSNYSGMDPEVSTRHSVLTPGFDYSPYPQPRTVTFGLNATL